MNMEWPQIRLFIKKLNFTGDVSCPWPWKLMEGVPIFSCQPCLTPSCLFITEEVLDQREETSRKCLINAVAVASYCNVGSETRRALTATLRQER